MNKTMKAVGFTQHLPITDPASLTDVTVPMPVAKGHDLLVKVDAVSVNPVDIGARKGGHGQLKQPRIIGWDAHGTVSQVGDAVTLFAVGDPVFYAGSFKRAGSDSEYQLVDERIVGKAPASLTPAQAAAIPLTALAAWEALFEQLAIDPAAQATNRQQTLLIINGAGGVGSIATQLAHWAGLQVIASASRPATIEWTLAHGADQTVNHRHDLVQEMHQLGFQTVDYILELNNIDAHWDEMAALIKPHGRIVSITENRQLIDLQKLTKKSVTFAWEWMFSKSYYQTPEMISQHQILNQVADLLDQGVLKTTLTKTLSPINASNLRLAHQMVESNQMIGKVVVAN